MSIFAGNLLSQSYIQSHTSSNANEHNITFTNIPREVRMLFMVITSTNGYYEFILPMNQDGTIVEGNQGYDGITYELRANQLEHMDGIITDQSRWANIRTMVRHWHGTGTGSWNQTTWSTISNTNWVNGVNPGNFSARSGYGNNSNTEAGQNNASHLIQANSVAEPSVPNNPGANEGNISNITSTNTGVRQLRNQTWGSFQGSSRISARVQAPHIGGWATHSVGTSGVVNRRFEWNLEAQRQRRRIRGAVPSTAGQFFHRLIARLRWIDYNRNNGTLSVSRDRVRLQTGWNTSDGWGNTTSITYTLVGIY